MVGDIYVAITVPSKQKQTIQSTRTLANKLPVFEYAFNNYRLEVRLILIPCKHFYLFLHVKWGPDKSMNCC
jgi:hypothetical protein